MPFQKGRAKTGGRAKGVINRKTRQRLQALAEAVNNAALNAEQIERLTPLSVMRLVMFRALDRGDEKMALMAAAEAAPYLHTKLTALDVTVRNVLALKSDSEIAEGLAQLEERMRAAETIDLPAAALTRIE